MVQILQDTPVEFVNHFSVKGFLSRYYVGYPLEQKYIINDNMKFKDSKVCENINLAKSEVKCHKTYD